MGYDVVVSEIADKKFVKLSKKNPKRMSIISKKVQQITLVTMMWAIDFFVFGDGNTLNNKKSYVRTYWSGL